MESLLQQLQKMNQFISAPCGGNGKCGKCAVRFKKGATEITARDREVFTEEQLKLGWRLACLSYPKEEYEIEIPDAEEKIFAQMDRTFSEQTKDGTSPKQLDGPGTFQRKSDYGIAIDIGTTTLAAVLVDLNTGKTVSAATGINHQRIYGSDVLSRIRASVDGRRFEMQRCIRQDLRKLIGELWTENIKKIVIAGNTTMCHLLRGFPCDRLGVAPFVPVDIGMMKGSAGELLGLKEFTAEVTILPGISAFIGADIASGAALLGMEATESYKLLLDIGTNGEMVLGKKDHLFAASTSAGPAFEGGNISCGMASIPGAISHVVIDEMEKAHVDVIGTQDLEKDDVSGEKAACGDHHSISGDGIYGSGMSGHEISGAGISESGICGSGMIDLYAEFLRHGIVDEYGTYIDEYFENGYFLTDTVKFTQGDIRELQMAKAAIRAGIEILLQKAGINASQVESCYLAGGFGSQMDVRNAVRIGLIPPELNEKTIAAGNTSLEGAKQYLLGRLTDAQLEKLIEDTKEVNLANEKEFEELYLQHM